MNEILFQHLWRYEIRCFSVDKNGDQKLGGKHLFFSIEKRYSETPILRPPNLHFSRILRFFRQVPVFPYTNNVHFTRILSLMFMEFPAFYVFMERKAIKNVFN